jgi:ubiquinone/menaquinone biosynthesis C-methylase UbiE
MSADQEFYAKGVPEQNIASSLNEMGFHYGTWAKERRRWYGNRTDVRVLDLGAGTCAVSALLSGEPWVGEVVAADISLPRMEMLAPRAQAMHGGDPAKIRFVEANFNDPLDFPDDYFDLVVMDGALHHSRAIWFTLSEIHRVLKPHGHFVAQREQFVAPLTAGLKMRRLLATEEVQQGVSENAYLKEQYDYYLRANGFRVRFAAVLPSPLFKALGLLNGLAFSRYNIIATKANDVALPVADHKQRGWLG